MASRALKKPFLCRLKATPASSNHLLPDRDILLYKMSRSGYFTLQNVPIGTFYATKCPNQDILHYKMSWASSKHLLPTGTLRSTLTAESIPTSLSADHSLAGIYYTSHKMTSTWRWEYFWFYSKNNLKKVKNIYILIFI